MPPVRQPRAAGARAASRVSYPRRVVVVPSARVTVTRQRTPARVAYGYTPGVRASTGSCRSISSTRARATVQPRARPLRRWQRERTPWPSPVQHRSAGRRTHPQSAATAAGRPRTNGPPTGCGSDRTGRSSHDARTLLVGQPNAALLPIAVVSRNSAPPHSDESPAERRKPRRNGAFAECAEEDSNLHPVIPDQALNLARLPIPPSARVSAEYSLGRRAVLRPS
jgi:hypothetical protein